MSAHERLYQRILALENRGPFLRFVPPTNDAKIEENRGSCQLDRIMQALSSSAGVHELIKDRRNASEKHSKLFQIFKHTLMFY